MKKAKKVTRARAKVATAPITVEALLARGDFTVREYAAVLGVSEQAAQKRLRTAVANGLLVVTKTEDEKEPTLADLTKPPGRGRPPQYRYALAPKRDNG